MSGYTDTMYEMIMDLSKGIDNMLGKFKEFGMTDKTIDKLLDGKEIRECYACHTPNMYETFKTNIFGVYICDKCGEVNLEEYVHKD